MALRELGEAIHNHDRWLRDLTRTLICRLPYDERDVAEDAHRHCRFGQWYHGAASERFGGHAGFAALEAEHQRMHRLAAHLLEASARQSTVPHNEYDTFANAVDQLQLQLEALRQEFEDSLYEHDPLTGADGRIGMQARLGEALEVVRRRVQACSLVVMDLDHFKALNDAHGHLIGDQVLAAVVAHVREHLRPYDRVFRYGGEEFLLLLANTDVPTAVGVVERIRAGLKSIALAHPEGKPVFVTASFGIAPLDPEASVEESIDRADKAMYAAKAAGRNCVRLSGCVTPQQS